MAMRKQHRILIATDGSGPAQDALATALQFPWPASSRVRAVVARSRWLPAVSEHARAAVERVSSVKTRSRRFGLSTDTKVMA